MKTIILPNGTETVETWNYTYDALNRLTAVDKPGDSDDITYTYDVRGNRTDIDISGSGTPDNTDLTFNIADQLTRVDNEDNSYKVFTYDDNGNCTKEEFYSGTYLMSKVVIPLDPNQTKQELLEENEEHQAKRVHYPFTHAPKELARTKYLSPYLPQTTDEDFYTNSMLEWTNPELAKLKRKQKWIPHQVRNDGRSVWNDGRSVRNDGINPYSVNPADETTDYEYDQENRLTKATLPSGIEIEFEYDGIGRRLKKIITDDTGSGSEDVVVTTTKYHYIGGQLTTIEIDEETTDDSDPPVSTATKDETIHIHLGPNSQPLSFEWVRYDYTEEETLDDTYFYHYDIHGNTIKITDEDGDVVVRYEYDVLGELVEEYNPDDIPNPFKWGGVSQLIHDEEIDMYTNKAGSYDPDTGTLLGGGAPVFTNPTSNKSVETLNQKTFSQEQHNKGIKTNDLELPDAGGVGWVMFSGLPEALQDGFARLIDTINSLNISISIHELADVLSLASTFFHHNKSDKDMKRWFKNRHSDMAYAASTAIAWEMLFYSEYLLTHINTVGLVSSIKDFMHNTFDWEGTGEYSPFMKKLQDKQGVFAGRLLKRYDGTFMTARKYFRNLTDYSYKKTFELLTGGYTFNRAHCDSIGRLAAKIFNLTCEYDAVHGADAHLEHGAKFDEWLIDRLVAMGYIQKGSGAVRGPRDKDGREIENSGSHGDGYKTKYLKTEDEKPPNLEIREGQFKIGGHRTIEIGPPLPISPGRIIVIPDQ